MNRRRLGSAGQAARIAARRAAFAILALACWAPTAAAAGGDFDLASLFHRRRHVEGSGRVVELTRDVAAFTRLDLRGSLDARVRVGPEQRVVLHVDDNLADLIDTRVRGRELIVEEEEDLDYTRGAYLEITVPSLTELAVHGSSDCDLAGLSGEEFAYAVYGSGDLTAAGTVEELSVHIYGSGDMEAKELRARTAQVKIAGSGDVEIAADEELSVTIMGSGDVDCWGRPALKKSIFGSGDVRLR